MKNRLNAISIVISLMALFFAGFTFFRTETIVYVDTLKLLSGYEGTVRAKAEYEQQTMQWKANIDTLGTELNAEVVKYQKSRGNLSARERKLTEDLIASKRQQFDNYKAAISENAARADQAVTGKVYDEIGAFLKRFGKAKGYNYIFASTNMGSVVYSSPGKNITDEVLEKLNGEYNQLAKK